MLFVHGWVALGKGSGFVPELVCCLRIGYVCRLA
jgi:hypothetical protein